MGRAAWLWGPLAAYMALIWLFSGHPNPPGAGLAKDYVLHAAAYAVLAVLALRAFNGGLGRLGASRTLGAMLLTIGYGAVDELHQGIVPGRDPSVGDWLADAAGAAVALMIFRFWIGRRSGGRQDR